MSNLRWNNLALLLLVVIAVWGCGKSSPEPGTVKDEALTVGRPIADG